MSKKHPKLQPPRKSLPKQAIQMEFTITCNELSKALAPAILVATTGIKRDYEGANKVTLHLSQGQLTIVAHGGHVSIGGKVILPARTRDGTITVQDARLLAATIAAFPPESTLICQTMTVAGENEIIFCIRDKEGVASFSLPGVVNPILMLVPISPAKCTFQMTILWCVNYIRVRNL